ncbi:MAG: hypothetical protein ACLTMH_16630 [Faecalimonas umbilicata]|uniref:hypothetical protein n=1 Tax=Faecalimonas umbilicata TaxID=1912855 RepID=UPI00399363E2
MNNRSGAAEETVSILQCRYCVWLYCLQNELFKKSAMRQERLVRIFSETAKEHYRIAKENIDIINRKCHDLKHQIGIGMCARKNRKIYRRDSGFHSDL